MASGVSNDGNEWQVEHGCGALNLYETAFYIQFIRDINSASSNNPWQGEIY